MLRGDLFGRHLLFRVAQEPVVLRHHSSHSVYFDHPNGRFGVLSSFRCSRENHAVYLRPACLNRVLTAHPRSYPTNLKDNTAYWTVHVVHDGHVFHLYRRHCSHHQLAFQDDQHARHVTVDAHSVSRKVALAAGNGKTGSGES